MDADKAIVDELRLGEARSSPADRSATGGTELLEQVLNVVSGLAGKREIDVEVISPLLLAETYGTTDVTRMLPAETLFSSGGFLDRALRRSDFQPARGRPSGRELPRRRPAGMTVAAAWVLGHRARSRRAGTSIGGGLGQEEGSTAFAHRDATFAAVIAVCGLIRQTTRPTSGGYATTTPPSTLTRA